jgi:hypothetical protein
MRLSSLRTGFVAAAAAIALGACAGHGMVPSQSGVPSGNFDSVLRKSKPSPCNLGTQGWYFHGACAAFLMKPNGITVKLPVYKSFTLDTTYGKSNVSPKGAGMITGDATGKGDITGTVGGHPFPPYGAGNDCVSSLGKAEACPGTVFLYAELINTSAKTITPKTTPQFVITTKTKFPGHTTCYPAVLTAKSKNSAGGWSPQTIIGSAPKGKTLTINSFNNTLGLVYPARSGLFVAAVCQ